MMHPDWFSARQNHDGGWGYAGNNSAVEPTVWALLALQAITGSAYEGQARALKWLAQLQRRDGGWPPRPDVAESTWVTGLVLLAAPAHPAAGTGSMGVPAQNPDPKGGAE